MTSRSVSVVIPTYRREQILLDTLRYVARQQPAPDEVLVVDQTPMHEVHVDEELRRLHDESTIRWIKLPRPSVPGAMNRGLVEARGEVVLFLDDDIVPNEGLIAAHERAHRDSTVAVVAGRVIQPWEIDVLPRKDCGEAGFSSTGRRVVHEFMAGNFSVKRSVALQIGGFDENFVHVAYRFERDFADRVLGELGCILFEPSATIHHLKAQEGGTRAYGHHLTTVRPSHAVGEYYYLLGRRSRAGLVGSLLRPWRAIATRHHLRRPWWIPVTLTAEVLGLGWAVLLRVRGPRYLGGKSPS
jgi:GT2 family glycosyltransferase